MSLSEPDVFFTDMILAAECGLFATLLCIADVKQRFLRGCFVLFFATTGIAAFFGAIAHGFGFNTASMGFRLLWITIFSAIGIAAIASWTIGAQLVFSVSLAKRLAPIAIASFVGYLAVILFVSQSFSVAIVYYLPAAVFLLVALVIAQLRDGASPNVAALGILLSFLAAYIQQAEISIAVLIHNALYHVVQGAALLLIFLGSLQLLKTVPPV